MTDFTSVSVRAPKDWQAFERHSRLLFEYSLGDPATQNNGRQGQAQHGVDIWGRRGGGDGPLVGIQCKGKDADYHGAVTKAELRREVKKSTAFRPSLKEFILITTAPDDAKIQEAARLLEEEVRKAGRDLSISVWGWERVQQEINRFGEVLKAFHPDASPFSDAILDVAAQTRQDTAQIREMLAAQQRNERVEDRALKLLESRLPPAQISRVDTALGSDPIDKLLNEQIDSFRDLIRNHRPATALHLLENLRETAWSTASAKVKFRIVANIGAAHHNLGDFEKGADLFLEAYPYNPDEPVSIANKIASLLIKGQQGEARQLARDAFAKFPESAEIALQRLQACDGDEDIESLWPTLEAQVREKPDLIFCRIGALREHGDPKWRELAAEVGSSPSADDRLKMFCAEAVLDKIFTADRSALGSAAADPPDQGEIAAAATTLDEIWQKSASGETPRNLGAAHNAALAYNILGRKADAQRLLDEALKVPGVADETKRLRLSVYPRSGPLTEAVALADTLGNAPQNVIMRAELRMHTFPREARELLKDRTSFANERDIVGASFIVVDSYLVEDDFAGALAEAEQLRTRFPEDAQSYLTIYRVKSASADADALEYLRQAAAKITKNSDFVSRFMVAEELANISRWDDVIQLLRPYVSTRYDSPSLRTLITAAANGDRREMLKSILDSLPAEVAKRPFYQRSRIALSIRIQNIKAAERQIRDYLEERPRSLGLQLQLLHALFRQDKLSELRKEVARPASDFDGEPIEFLQLAQFKDSFGNWRDAHALAYQTFLKRFDDGEVNMAYVAVFLHPGHSTGLIVDPPAVGENMAVAVMIGEADLEIYILEPDPGLRPTAQYIAPGHPIAMALLGHAVGDEIRLPDGKNAKIVSIKPKVLHALHEVMDNFQRRFPENEGLERVEIDTATAAGMGEIIERLRQRHEAIESAFRTYESGFIPIACTAKSLGKSTVETFIAITASNRNIRVCEGTKQERDAAFAAIRENAKRGCVLDPISLHIVRRLQLESAVEAVCGPISTVEDRVLWVTQQIYDLEQTLDQEGISLSWSDGQTYRHEITPEQKRQELERLRADRDWMRSRLEVLRAQGSADPPPELSDITARFGSGFLDEARAAQGSDRLFICEDQPLRLLAMAGFKIRTSWLQPVLMVAKNSGHITQEQYRRAIVAFIDGRLEFISVDAQLISSSLAPTASIELPLGFTKIASRLGGAIADLNSHANVVLGTIAQFWNNSALPWTLREAAVGTLLENLCRERTLPEVKRILRQFALFNREVLRNANLDEYLHGWARGHFIPL